MKENFEIADVSSLGNIARGLKRELGKLKWKRVLYVIAFYKV